MLDAQMGTEMVLFDRIHTWHERKREVWDLGFKFIQYEHFGFLFGTPVISGRCEPERFQTSV